MGCTFDSFSSSWSDRSYVLTLLVLAWIIPLVIIFLSYIGIIYEVVQSSIKTPHNPIPCRRSTSGSRLGGHRAGHDSNAQIDRNVEHRVS